VKIKCPKCREDAVLSPDFAKVKCGTCKFDMSYGDYVEYVAHNDPTYSDILSDYAGAAGKGQSSGTLDEWD